MSNRDKDDLARALEALSAGEHAEEPDHHGTHYPEPAPPVEPPRTVAPTRPPVRSSGSTPAESRSKPPPVAPQSSSTAKAAQRRSAAPTTSTSDPTKSAARPTSAPPEQRAPATSAQPAIRPSAPSTARPSTARPSTPAARPAAPAARPTTPHVARPAAPALNRPGAGEVSLPPQPPVDEVDDDDAVIVPAPDASVFFHKPAYAAKQHIKPFGQSLRFRQTVIPILLTAGLIMNGLATLHFVWRSDNNPMGGLPIWLLIVLFIFGLAIWGMAVMNMLAVKQELDARKNSSPA